MLPTREVLPEPFGEFFEYFFLPFGDFGDFGDLGGVPAPLRGVDFLEFALGEPLGDTFLLDPVFATGEELRGEGGGLRAGVMGQSAWVCVCAYVFVCACVSCRGKSDAE